MDELYANLFACAAGKTAAWTVDIDHKKCVRLHDVDCDSKSMNLESLDIPLSVGLDMGYKGVEFKLQEAAGVAPSTSPTVAPHCQLVEDMHLN